jgi:hypothetical protein
LIASNDRLQAQPSSAGRTEINAEEEKFIVTDSWFRNTDQPGTYECRICNFFSPAGERLDKVVVFDENVTEMPGIIRGNLITVRKGEETLRGLITHDGPLLTIAWSDMSTWSRMVPYGGFVSYDQDNKPHGTSILPTTDRNRPQEVLLTDENGNKSRAVFISPCKLAIGDGTVEATLVYSGRRLLLLFSDKRTHWERVYEDK